MDGTRRRQAFVNFVTAKETHPDLILVIREGSTRNELELPVQCQECHVLGPRMRDLAGRQVRLCSGRRVYVEVWMRKTTQTVKEHRSIVEFDLEFKAKVKRPGGAGRAPSLARRGVASEVAPSIVAPKTKLLASAAPVAATDSVAPVAAKASVAPKKNGSASESTLS